MEINVAPRKLLGAGVDAASGAAYDYPALFQVVMGQQQTLQAPAPQNQAQAQPQPQVAATGGTQ